MHGGLRFANPPYVDPSLFARSRKIAARGAAHFNSPEIASNNTGSWNGLPKYAFTPSCKA